MEVPEIVLVVVMNSIQAEVIEVPGAKTSRYGP